MLYSVDEGQIIRYIPHERFYHLWRSRLTDDEYRAITDDLNRLIDANAIHTSSWMPVPDWTDTVLEPIYSKACLEDENEAAKCFGLFLWVVMMDRPERWAFGRYNKNNIPIEGLTYFQVNV